MLENLQTVAAERTRKGALNLIQLLHATPTEKLHWKPLGCGRSVIEQVIECILVNQKWALTLRQGVYTRLPVERVKQVEATCQEAAQAQRLLGESADALAAAILSLPAGQLEGQITAPLRHLFDGSVLFAGLLEHDLSRGADQLYSDALWR